MSSASCQRNTQPTSDASKEICADWLQPHHTWRETDGPYFPHPTSEQNQRQSRAEEEQKQSAMEEPAKPTEEEQKEPVADHTLRLVRVAISHFGVFELSYFNT